MTQTEFAECVGKPQSVISRLENTEYGRVNVQSLLDVACAMNVALVIKFMSHEDFFSHMDGPSFRPEALRVETFPELLDRHERVNVEDISEGLRKEIGTPTDQTQDVILLDVFRAKKSKLGIDPDVAVAKRKSVLDDAA